MYSSARTVNPPEDVKIRYLIYGLVDPRSKLLRYVGKSTSGLSRPRAHLRPSVCAKERNYKSNWIRQLAASGLKPNIVVIQAFDSAELLYRAEQRWISHLRGNGHPLTNLTDGGPGSFGLTASVETRAKLSIARLGRRFSEEHKQNMRGPKSREHRAKIAAFHRGLRHSTETKEKLSKANLGKVLAAVTRAKISDSLLGRSFSPAHRKHLSAANCGRQVSEATRLKVARSLGARAFVDQHGNSYESAAQAARVLGLRRSNIASVLKQRLKSTGGYKFVYCAKE